MKNEKKVFTDDEKVSIIEEMMPYITITAEKLAWRLPDQIGVNDLISIGKIGILSCFDKYDESKSNIKTYIRYRIKGAMLDELRERDWRPRQVQVDINKLNSITHELEKRLCRKVESEDIAAELDISLEEIYYLKEYTKYEDNLRFEDYEGKGDILEVLSDNQDISLKIEIKQRKYQLLRNIKKLPKREQVIIVLSFWGGLGQLKTEAVISLGKNMEGTII